MKVQYLQFSEVAEPKWDGACERIRSEVPETGTNKDR